MSLKKKITLIILLLSSAFSISMGVCFAHYTHKDPINDYYNNQIITDFAFKAKDTMTEQQIQQFLADKGSALTNYTIPTDGSVSTMIGPGDSVNGSGWTASKVIYMAAQWYELNPQVILATLQKESSLVTSGNLNYVNTAMGYACSESSPCSPSYFGFARQIDWASWQLGYYNFHYSELKDTSRAGQYYVGNTAVIDGKNTYISNSATAALYRYTPHRPDSAWLTATDGNHYYGNYNFIYFYSHWFNFADVIRTSVKSNPGVDFEKSNIFLGENVVGSMTLKNSSDVGIDLNNIVVITINKSTGKQTDLLYASHTFAAEGQEGDTFTSQIPFNPKEAGEYKFLVMTCYNNEWISLSDYTYVNVTKPNIKTTWSLVPSKAAVSTPVTPQLKVKNFESVPITLEAVGTAVWYQWPQPKDRSFEYQSNVTIPANTELTINIPAKTFTEIGSYGYWPIYKIAGNWYQLEHITGWSTFGWMEVTKPNIKTTWSFVPSKASVTTTVTPQLKIRNFENSDVTLEAAGTAVWYQWPQPKDRSFEYQSLVTIPANGEITVTLSGKSFNEIGKYGYWPVYKIAGNWYQLEHVTGWSTFGWMEITKPNIKTTWSLVPSKAAVSTPVTPQLKVKNFESVPITLEAVGTAVWYQWPQPKDRSFEYQSNVTIPANTELTINIPAKTFTEIGSYGYWPIYKIAGNWYQLEHITGWSTFGWMEIQG